MKSILKIQKDSVNTLKEELLAHSNSKLKKTYVVTGTVKESGWDIIEEFLIDLKARKFIALGIDKKNTTKKMLEGLLKYTKNVYVWDNNSEVEFNSNVFVFEYEDEAHVYTFAGDITESMLETDISMYTIAKYDLFQDKKEYAEFVDALTSAIKDSFAKLTKEYIEELLENKLIFTTKQYNHVLPSIAELLGKSEKQTEEVVSPKVEIPKIDIESSNLDSFEIDLGDISLDTPSIELEDDTPNFEEKDDVEEVEEETEAFGLNEVFEDEDIKEEIEYIDAIDMESLVLESEVIKVDKKAIEKKKSKEVKEEQKQLSKKINLTNVSNIIMELAKKPSKGKDVSKIKIPNYIKEMIPQFFDIMEDAKLQKYEDGEYRIAEIKLEIIDVNNSNKFVDNNAVLKQKIGQTYLEFESEYIKDVMYEELDIARVIKLSKDSYHIEFIPNGIDEYLLWKKMCTNSFRGTDRQYGLM